MPRTELKTSFPFPDSGKGVRGLGLFLGLLVILGLILAACGDNPAPVSQNSAGNNSTAAKTQPPVKMEVGYSAPDFTAKTVSGETIQLSQLRGRAVIINFWATY